MKNRIIIFVVLMINLFLVGCDPIANKNFEMNYLPNNKKICQKENVMKIVKNYLIDNGYSVKLEHPQDFGNANQLILSFDAPPFSRIQSQNIFINDDCHLSIYYHNFGRFSFDEKEMKKIDNINAGLMQVINQKLRTKVTINSPYHE